jgi:hypothetical protein
MHWPHAALALGILSASPPDAAVAALTPPPAPAATPASAVSAPLPAPSASGAPPVAVSAPSKASLGAAFQFYTIDYLGGNPVAGAYPIGWNRFLFFPNGQVNPELGFRARLAVDNFGVSASGLGAGHLRSSGLDVGSPFYVDWAYASFEPPGHSWHAGIMNLSHELKIGSAIPNPFDASAVYSITFTRYGGVGTPPLTAARTLDASPGRPGNWLMGTNVAIETLDPNSTFANFPAPGLSLIYQTELADTRLSLATFDGTSGASIARSHDPAQARTLYLPLNFPETAPYHQGYSLALFERRFAPLRVQLGLRADNSSFGTALGKASSLTVEAGDEQLAGSLTLAGSGLPFDRLGAYVWRDGLAGFGVGLGLKATGIGPLQPTGFPSVSYGPLLRTPAWGWLPRWTIAAQETRGALGETLASGLTLETSARLHPALPMLGVEYSLGKFDPAGRNGLLDLSTPFTHQLYSVLTTVSF